jgi:hypothetical protein
MYEVGDNVLGGEAVNSVTRLGDCNGLTTASYHLSAAYDSSVEPEMMSFDSILALASSSSLTTAS